METFINELLGGMPAPVFAVAFFFAMIGAIISLLNDAVTRDPSKEGSPVKFRYWFLVLDNWKRILLVILLIAVFIRFSEDLTGQRLTMFWALVIGFCWDMLVGILKKRSSLLKVSRKILNAHVV